MKTTMTIMFANGGTSEHPLPDFPQTPDYDRLKALIEPHLNGDSLERVSVLHPDYGPSDMFVGEMSAINGQPLNPKATLIYRNNWLRGHAHQAPDSFPAIYGTAVQFNRRVWF